MCSVHTAHLPVFSQDSHWKQMRALSGKSQ